MKCFYCVSHCPPLSAGVDPPEAVPQRNAHRQAVHHVGEPPDMLPGFPEQDPPRPEIHRQQHRQPADKAPQEGGARPLVQRHLQVGGGLQQPLGLSGTLRAYRRFVCPAQRGQYRAWAECLQSDERAGVVSCDACRKQSSCRRVAHALAHCHHRQSEGYRRVHAGDGCQRSL